MSDFDDTTQTQPTPEPPSEPRPAAFCQHCGRPLTPEMIRQVGASVFCEPCLAARIGAPIPGATPPGSGYSPVNPGAPYTGQPWTSGLSTPGPNPGLAALLGLIPGVGAMYNEQYAKGIVHLVVFAILVSLADNVNGIFGLFVAGWEFYMAIEAHHTARARRDGTPLPNPFGLNDIGERLGFGKSWPNGPSVADVANDAAATAAAAAASFNRPYPQPPYPAPAAAEPWGAPTDSTAQSTAQSATQTPYNPVAGHTWVPDPSTYGTQYGEQLNQQIHTQAVRDAGFVPPATSAPYTPVPPYNQSAPYNPVQPPFYDPSLTPRPNRFPAGAVVLIGLGVIFLLTTTGIFNGFPAEALVGCVTLGIGAWIFLRRMMENGASGLTHDGSPGYFLRLVNALRFSIWLATLGLLFLLDAFSILVWHHSWPLLIIVAGVMALLQRAASQALADAYMHPHPVAATEPAPVHSSATKGGN